MKEIQKVEVQGMRVLTTKQLASMYGTKEDRIRWNFKYNKAKYIPGKHFIIIEGEELREMKRECEFQTLLKQAKSVCFWTERGALLHAKSLNTDKAWEVYEYLVDFYFRVQEQEPVQQYKPVQQAQMKVCSRRVVDVPENRTIQNVMQQLHDDLTCTKVLLRECNQYMPKEKYIKARDAAEDTVEMLIKDFARLQSMTPREIEKIY